MIVGDAMRPVLSGAVFGVAGAIALSWVLRGLVYGIGVTDPVALGGSIVALISVALLASWIPARPASKVDPIIALRADENFASARYHPRAQRSLRRRGTRDWFPGHGSGRQAARLLERP